MKIIGEGREGFILMATQSEAANLVGYYSHYSDGARTALRVGDEIQVHKMYEQMRKFAGMRAQLAAARESLASIGRQLELVNPLLPEATVEEPKP